VRIARFNAVSQCECIGPTIVGRPSAGRHDM
jgi:hypothetical protein